MSKIISAVSRCVGRYTFGQNFQKGDYLYYTRWIEATTSTGGHVELNHAKVLSAVGGTRITAKKLASLSGKDVSDFV